jgi:antitoxin component YwqK of YwqJK toxin-antitoxin module
MKQILQFCTVTSLLTILFSCGQTGNHETINDSWFEAIKQKILIDTDKQPDSLVTEKGSTDYLTVFYYKDGKKYIERHLVLPDSAVGWEKLFGSGNIEIRHEFYPKGQVGFEGVFINDRPYGLSTWFHKNGEIDEQGIRYKDKKVGIWKTWDEEGNLKETTNYHNEQLLDSLKKIQYQ